MMNLVVAVAAATTASLGLVHGAAIPQLNPLDGLQSSDGGLSPNQQALQSFSQLFSYRLAGVADGSDELLMACNNLESMGKEKWEAIGLDWSIIQAPVCTISQTTPNSTYAITNSMMAHSHLLTTQLLNSFNSTDRFNTLCDNLELDLIDYFPAIGNVVKAAVCKHSRNRQMPPQPFNNPPPANAGAVRAAKNTESTLFAMILAAGLTTSSDLSGACARVPYYAQNLFNEQLNGTAVVSTLCSIKEPIPVQEAKAMMRTWTTRYYITVLENVSNMDGWLDWLCKNVDVEKMNAVGLQGIDVQQRVCSDKAYLTTADAPAPSARI